jgi:ABC-type branched-subunit amino acid transport system substrate-binding protein
MQSTTLTDEETIKPSLLQLQRLLQFCLPILLVLSVAACAVPRPVIKIALVAPFEGYYREVGYDAFPAMRLALREQIRSGGVGYYEVSFVAYNDNADPVFAERVAHNVVLDDDVIAVIGNLRRDTTLAALPVYTSSLLPVIVTDIPADVIPASLLVFRMGPSTSEQVDALNRCPDSRSQSNTQWLQPYKGNISPFALEHLADFQSPAATKTLGESIAGLCFATTTPYPRDLPAAERALAGFAEVSGAAGAGSRSISAYDATRLLLRAISDDVAAHGRPTRVGVAEALRRISYNGLLGKINFDGNNRWASAPVWVYQYEVDGTAKMIGDTR